MGHTLIFWGVILFLLDGYINSQSFLPAGLLEYFTLKDVKELCSLKDKTVYFEINLEENNRILGNIDVSQYESKGFTEITLQDFPIRGKAVIW